VTLAEMTIVIRFDKNNSVDDNAIDLSD